MTVQHPRKKPGIFYTKENRGSLYAFFPDGTEADDVLSWALMDTELPPENVVGDHRMQYRYVPAFNGHEFEILTARVSAHYNYNNNWHVRFIFPQIEHVGEWHMLVHYPIHPKTKVVDWKGARRAKMNGNNTYWIPEHVDADWHYDFEYAVEAAVDSVFSKEIDDLQESVDAAIVTAINPNLSGNAASNARAQINPRRAQLNTLRRIRHDVKTYCTYFTQEMTLGYVQQNPSESHVHSIIKRELARAIKLWKADETKAALLSAVNAELTRISKRVDYEHTYKRRWEKTVVFPQAEASSD